MRNAILASIAILVVIAIINPLPSLMVLLGIGWSLFVLRVFAPHIWRTLGNIIQDKLAKRAFEKRRAECLNRLYNNKKDAAATINQISIALDLAEDLKVPRNKDGWNYALFVDEGKCTIYAGIKAHKPFSDTDRIDLKTRLHKGFKQHPEHLMAMSSIEFCNTDRTEVLIDFEMFGSQAETATFFAYMDDELRREQAKLHPDTPDDEDFE